MTSWSLNITSEDIDNGKDSAGLPLWVCSLPGLLVHLNHLSIPWPGSGWCNDLAYTLINLRLPDLGLNQNWCLFHDIFICFVPDTGPRLLMITILVARYWAPCQIMKFWTIFSLIRILFLNAIYISHTSCTSLRSDTVNLCPWLTWDLHSRSYLPYLLAQYSASATWT